MNKKSSLSIICAAVMAVGSNLVIASDHHHDYSQHDENHRSSWAHRDARGGGARYSSREHYRKNKVDQMHRYAEHDSRHSIRYRGNDHHSGYYQHRDWYGDGYTEHHPNTCARRDHHQHRSHRNRGSHFTDNVSIWFRF